jgi:hypothetical protein
MWRGLWLTEFCLFIKLLDASGSPVASQVDVLEAHGKRACLAWPSPLLGIPACAYSGSVGFRFARENRMARQVIQIAADTGQIYALCDDGEIFRFSGETWHPVSPIPQGDPRDAAKPKQKIGFVDDEPGG